MRITFSCTFRCRHCTTTTWKCLISRFMEDINKRWWIFLSLFKLEYGPLRNQLKGNSPSFDIFSELEEMQQSLKKRGFVLQVTFSLPSPSSMLKLPNKGRRTAWWQFRGNAIEELWRGGLWCFGRAGYTHLANHIPHSFKRHDSVQNINWIITL